MFKNFLFFIFTVFFSTIHKLGDMIWKLEIFKEEYLRYLQSSSCIYHPRYFWFKRSFTRKVGGDKQQKAVSLFVVKRKIGPLPTIILVESKKFEISKDSFSTSWHQIKPDELAQINKNGPQKQSSRLPLK